MKWQKGISQILFLITTLVLLTVITGCSQFNPKSESPATNTIILEEFNEIKFEAVGRIHLAQGDSNSITLIGDASYIEKVKTVISNQTLEISIEPDVVLVSADPDDSIQFFISFQKLDSIFLRGNYTLDAQGVEGEIVKIDIQGIGPVQLEDIRCERLDIELSGGGVITISGIAGEQQLKISGAHIYNGAELKSKIITADLSGQSNTVLWAEETLNLKISENASVGYYGNLETMNSISEQGNVRFLGLK